MIRLSNPLVAIGCAALILGGCGSLSPRKEELIASRGPIHGPDCFEKHVKGRLHLLRKGMSESEVRALLGRPTLQSENRWCYSTVQECGTYIVAGVPGSIILPGINVQFSDRQYAAYDEHGAGFYRDDLEAFSRCDKTN